MAQFIQAEQTDAAAAVDRPGKLLVLSRRCQLADELRGEGVADPVAGRVHAQPDEHVRLPGPKVADQAQRVLDLPAGFGCSRHTQ